MDKPGDDLVTQIICDDVLEKSKKDPHAIQDFLCGLYGSPTPQEQIDKDIAYFSKALSGKDLSGIAKDALAEANKIKEDKVEEQLKELEEQIKQEKAEGQDFLRQEIEALKKDPEYKNKEPERQDLIKMLSRTDDQKSNLDLNRMEYLV